MPILPLELLLDAHYTAIFTASAVFYAACFGFTLRVYLEAERNETKCKNGYLVLSVLLYTAVAVSLLLL